MKKDYYKILGLKKDATDEEIKEAYEALKAKYDPLKYEDKIGAIELMKVIQDAYEILSDPVLRELCEMDENKLKEVLEQKAKVQQKKKLEEKQEKKFSLDDVMDTGESKVKILPSLSGLLQKMGDDIFYQTVFAEKDGEFTPLVLSSWSRMPIPVKTGFIEDDGKIIDTYNYIEYEGFNYRFKNKVYFNSSEGINTINNAGIRGYASPGYLPLKEDVYKDILLQIKSYHFHPSTFEYDVLFASVIQSYIYQTIGRVFYLVLQSTRPGTGKTVLLTLLSYLCMNGRLGGKSSVPGSIRLIDNFGITLCQDDVDKTSDEEKSMIIGSFNSGFNRGMPYTVADKNDQRKSISYNIFCPKYFSCNNLDGFDDTMVDRCYTLEAVKAGVRTKDIYQAKDEEFKQFQDIRNQTFVYCTIHWVELVQDINDVKEELQKKGLFGREVDKYSIILGIIKHFKGEEYAIKVWNYMKGKLPVEHEDIETHSLMDSTLLEAVVSRYKDGKYEPILEIPAKWLHEKMCTKLGKPTEGRNSISNQEPYHILHGLQIITEKREKTTKNNLTVYLINTEKLRQTLIRLDYKTIASKIPPRPTEPSEPPSSKDMPKL